MIVLDPVSHYAFCNQYENQASFLHIYGTVTKTKEFSCLYVQSTCLMFLYCYCKRHDQIKV